MAGQKIAKCGDAKIQKNFIQFGQRVTAGRGNRHAVGTAVFPLPEECRGRRRGGARRESKKSKKDEGIFSGAQASGR